MALIDDKKVVEEKSELLENKEEEMVAREEEKEVDDVKDDVVDIDLSVTRKKRFRIDGDNDRILELDVSDMSIVNRLEKIYPKLKELSEKASEDFNIQENDDSEEVVSKTSKALNSIDEKMRKLMDELFDTNVSEICAPSGTMYDPYHGKFRFEHILEAILGLYENNLSSEFQKMSKRISGHTNKYTKKK